MSTSDNSNVIWLDWAKVIGILIVVFGHVLQRIPGWEEGGIRALWDWIYLFHMPLFFVISGYLYKQNARNLSKIFWVLVVPYILYQLLYMPLWNWKAIGTDETLFSFIGKHVMGILLGDGYKTPISLYSCLPCWFIISIIHLRLFFSFVRINKLTSTLLVVASVCFLYVRKSYGFDLYACVDSTVMAIPYFLFGYWMKMSEIGKKITCTLMGGVKIQMLSCIVLCAITILILIYNGAAQMNGPSVGKDVIINYISGISGTLTIFSISMLSSKIPEVLKTVSRNTLFIIFFHWCCLYLVRKQLFVGSGMLLHIAEAMIISIAILFINYIAITVLNKHFPVLLGKYKRTINT